jgi:hypothetical protein
MHTVSKQMQIDPRVRAKLEELGADTIRSKLLWIMNVTTLAQQDEKQPLGDDLYASRREMQQWLRQREARESYWIKAGVIIATIAAFFAFLAWRFPVLPP